MKVLLDTSFLVTAAKYKIDWSEQLRGNELFVLDTVLSELDGLKRGGGKDAAFANVALSLAKERKIKIILSDEGRADRGLEEEAKRGYIICTQDIELKKKIKKQSGIVYSICQKSKIEEV